MCMNFYVRMRNGQNMKHQKRENTGSIVLTLEMTFIIIIIMNNMGENPVGFLDRCIVSVSLIFLF